LPIEHGRDFNSRDGLDAVIIGRTLADLLSPGGDPVSRVISDGAQTYHVIGVLTRKEEALAASNGPISPYSNPNSAVFRFSPALAAGQEGEAQILQVLTVPGVRPSVAKMVQRMFRSKENLDTIVTAVSRNSIVPSVVGITVWTRILSLLSSYALLTVIGCFLAVAVSLYIEFATRVQVMSIQRALGTSRRSVIQGFIAEACSMALAVWGIASLILLALARPWTRMLQTLLQSGAVDILNRSRATVILAEGPGYPRLSSLAVLASLIPARGISRINPVPVSGSVAGYAPASMP
jgi:ABC-type antimicrobial peptide transport system permease subunit